ncbi:MAG: tRNA 2-thiouridine(34) synthase MnmA [Elusimicrobia bacterium]|nr:tRNA 2-thiouridine(34) synthase MnmA [Elusimicrobiota bacterium]
MEKRALIAMSGGVDSSVAAFLLRQQGYDCIGCTMKLYNNEDIGIKSRTCCSLNDVNDARSVAYKLNMKYYVLNYTSDFKKQVIDKFVKSYESAVTPNPCIDCNKYMKFEKLYNMAKNLECNYIVTGHYARIEKVKDKFYLKKAVDDTKDQSYVLYNLTQEQLAHTLFPLGNLHKTEIRDIAKENGFVNASKPDSQDICFVQDGNYVRAIEKFSDKQIKEGNFIDKSGKVIGKHKGIVYYTIGQRRGLGCFQKHVYVCKISAQDNTVMLGDEKDLYKKEFIVTNFNWILGKPPAQNFSCSVKIRYKQKEHAADIIVLDDNTVKIVFEQEQKAITPGQAAVLYDGDIVLGGGTIVGENG